MKSNGNNDSSHIAFQLNNSKNSLKDKNDKKNKNEDTMKRNKSIDYERNNSLSSIRSLNNSESENDNRNIMEEKETKSKLVLHKMLTNNYKKLNSDIDLINRAIRLQDLVNMMTSFFLYYPENNNYPFVEIYDEHKKNRTKREIKDFIDKKTILDHLEENIEDFNDQLAGVDDVNDDNKNDEYNDNDYSIEINEKYDKFPESRTIQIYESDDLNEIIEK
ncbi:hypothetical protein BCR32DRAFT_249927 [Anaeromyces robustus]|uniref:Uncharacterized protein n=1 Tax=Anaeromyces robustus TaxID=1754192 RepID=A0A1Y1WIW5_9FUNG|nr:hypothetical protein BCR32DRAFT_249927 [Anaeromyces robustus]|eukprot:ORX73477.1 hypothetical protein BCR32DRAFT_249927 [Anaeromyces robustus]